MTCDRRYTFSASANTYTVPDNHGRARLFSSPDKQDLETIYENEANSTGGDTNKSQSSNKTNADIASKRTRIQAVFLSRTNTNEKSPNTVLTNSVGVFSHTTNNTSGPGGGSANNEINDGSTQPDVVAALAQHASAALPVASLDLPSGKSQLITTNSTTSSSSTKQAHSQRARSQSKTDTQSVTDKSLFSRIFSKKSKKPLGSLITTTTKSIDLDTTKTRPKTFNKSLQIRTQRSIINEQDEYGYSNDDQLRDSNVSTGSLSDTDQFDDEISPNRSYNTTRAGSRTNSGTGKKSNVGGNSMLIPTSDSQYYASMSSAPAGFSISYHKRMGKGNDDLRIQAALSRLQQQQQNKKGVDGGTNQLMSLFQDPKRNATQSPTPMPGTTRVKTFSGQTIITRNSSSSDRPSAYVFRPSSISPTHDADETFVSDEEIYTHFMKCHTCYDIMPKSSKLVVFDTQLGVKKAFFALVYNGVRAAPLWDTKRQKFIGILTITDFILMLEQYYKEPHAKIDELEEHIIETWRDVLREYEKPLLSIRPNQSLYEAVSILLDNHVHRLPIIDPATNNVVFILTHKRILRFFYLYIYDWPQPSFMSKTLEELNIGTYDNLHIIEENSTVIEALSYFVKHRVSALPVVDKNKKLVNIYSKFDIIGLVPDKSYRNLNMTINEALIYRKERFEAVAKCYKHELLSICIERIIRAEVHRLVIVDNDEYVIGILSLSDLLDFLILRPTKSKSTEEVS
ncbi:unnamed protein product [Adineta steineri]|uniref:CBS domain-containing protein n=1 Tax=Adineta steineri TaxID=433720 RepID=A0A816E9J7_9BILA|nr:unnamed protein product [Adineta steineri]CAF1647514.1 unnamed protein product [Adineta steineri]